MPQLLPATPQETRTASAARGTDRLGTASPSKACPPPTATSDPAFGLTTDWARRLPREPDTVWPLSRSCHKDEGGPPRGRARPSQRRGSIARACAPRIACPSLNGSVRGDVDG